MMDQLKIYHVMRNDGADYDEYDAAIVVAQDREDAIQMLKDKHGTGIYCTWGSYDVSVIELDINTRQIVLESFNAG